MWEITGEIATSVYTPYLGSFPIAFRAHVLAAQRFLKFLSDNIETVVNEV